MSLDRRRFLAAALAAPALGRWEIQEEPPAGTGASRQDEKKPVLAPRVARFREMGFGMFLHWGLYSQLGAGEWAMHFRKMEPAGYMKLMGSFRAEGFSGREIARVARRAGMRYATLTSRHHDGFSLYDTRGLSPLDVTHTPAKRDLVADFVEGCRAEGVVPMLYCTTLDWSDSRFEKDWKAYQRYLRDSVELLCTRYGPIGGFWFDGNWSRKDVDWELDALYGLIRRHQPEALIINNTGIEAGGTLVHPEIDSVTFERGRPEPIEGVSPDKVVAGEMCHTFNFHWGIATRDFNYLSPAHVIEELCQCRRVGANLLMNVGPDASGRIPDYERAALARVGDWIALHGGAEGPIYRGRPAAARGEGDDFVLDLGERSFAFITGLTRTADSRAHGEARGAGPRVFRDLRPFAAARWLDDGEALKLEREGGRTTLHATAYPYGTNTVVRVAELRPA
ncbi:MAG: alpha-L-fucosidase [Planctomycetota bacterium]